MKTKNNKEDFILLCDYPRWNRYGPYIGATIFSIFAVGFFLISLTTQTLSNIIFGIDVPAFDYSVLIVILILCFAGSRRANKKVNTLLADIGVVEDGIVELNLFEDNRKFSFDDIISLRFFKCPDRDSDKYERMSGVRINTKDEVCVVYRNINNYEQMLEHIKLKAGLAVKEAE